MEEKRQAEACAEIASAAEKVAGGWMTYTSPGSWNNQACGFGLSGPVTDKPYGVVFSNTSPWSRERLEQAERGEASREGVLYYEVPANYDPDAAPPGKQMMLTGSFSPGRMRARVSGTVV